MVLIRSWSSAARLASGGEFLNILDGGLRELVTRIRALQKPTSTAETKAATAIESVTSSAPSRACRPVILWMWAAVSSESACRSRGWLGLSALACEFLRHGPAN